MNYDDEVSFSMKQRES